LTVPETYSGVDFGAAGAEVLINALKEICNRQQSLV